MVTLITVVKNGGCMALASSRYHLTKVWSRLLQLKSKADVVLFTLIAYISRPVDLISDYITRISSTYWKVAFFGLLLLYTIGLLVQARSYSADARLFPFLVGGPLALMIALYIGLVLSPWYSGRTSGVFDSITDEALSDAEANIDRSGPDESTLRVQRELKMTFWTVGVLFLTYLIGFLNTLAIFLFVFIYIYEQTLIRAVLVTVLSLAFVQVFFVDILSLPLWEGAVFSSLVFATPEGWDR